LKETGLNEAASQRILSLPVISGAGVLAIAIVFGTKIKGKIAVVAIMFEAHIALILDIV
jgi:hypothetical protein